MHKLERKKQIKVGDLEKTEERSVEKQGAQKKEGGGEEDRKNWRIKPSKYAMCTMNISHFNFIYNYNASIKTYI